MEPRAADDRPAALLALAASHFREGRTGQAWEACAEAAGLARASGDAAALADAATVVRGVGPTPLAGRIHRLCVEALAALAEREARGDADPVRRARVTVQLEATRSPWARPAVPVEGPEGDPDDRFLALHAEYALCRHVAHLERRLRIADEVVALGYASGSDEYTATGLSWRIEALGQCGRRWELDAEVAALAAVVDGGRVPGWRRRLALTRACLLLADGRFADARALVAGDSGFVALVVASHLAVLTGEGLDDVEREVRAAVDDLPYLARAWHAQVLGALGRLDEARELWRAIAPHVREVPRESPEWLIAGVGHAVLAVLLGDAQTAAAVYDELAPWADLFVIAGADTPNEGPVALALGRLAALLGRTAQARSHLMDALRAAERTHALPHVAQAHLELARLGGAGSGAHAEAAAALAARLGMAPLAAEVAALTPTRGPSRGPLSPRESEIAALVADGLANRAIAQRLTLSERTVENHVSHIMRKLDRPSRVAIAAWVREGRGPLQTGPARAQW